MNLAKPYDQSDFLEFIKDFLPDFKKDVSLVNLLHEFKTITKVTQLGRSELLDLDVYEFKALGKSQKKISQAIESFRVIKQQMSFRALVSYQSGDDQNWRLALLQMTPDLTEEGKRTQKFSNPRRYSFLLGPTAKIKTPTKFLDTVKKIADFVDLEKRFSVEVVNKDFYNQIALFFSRLTGGDRKSGSKQLHFEPEMALPPQSNPDKKKYQEFAVRLIGRVIFCWFLKQKKSKNDLSLLPEEYLSSNAVRANDNYYHNVLEKVFFEVLNRPLNDRKSEIRNGYDTIPYLNGGLFDPHADDYYQNDQPFWALTIPNKWFEEFFEILETYNFTIDENTAIDTDLSIDPEMLGRIFENLLAEINPETGESARKSTGSYYTPRPIVEYMVDQSLIQYLITKTAINEEKIKALISIDLEDDQSFPLTEEEKVKVVDALNTIRMIDPACGSGAFPIGLLQKIIWVLQHVDKDAKLWFTKKIEGLDPLLQDEFKRKFEHESLDYIRKTGVIKDSIYGVDIQPVAVEVSKLRCFLTLIVDEDIVDEAENRGVIPLPNLEFKFVAANTLIGLPGSAKANGGQESFLEEENEIDQLKRIRDRYFVCNGTAKDSVKLEFYRIQKKMFEQQIQNARHGFKTMALAKWDPFKNDSSEWFDPEWMFGISAFDIVIGNPPYGASLTDLEKEYYRRIYQSAKTTKGLKGSVDTYSLFIDRGHQLVRANGFVWLIVSMSITCSESETALHDLLYKTCGEIRISSYGDRPQQIFPAAHQRVSIISFNKNDQPIDKLFCTKMQRRREIDTIDEIIKNLSFVNVNDIKFYGRIPKIGTDTEVTIYKKLQTMTQFKCIIKKQGTPIYYRTSGGDYYKLFTNYSTGSSKETHIRFDENISNAMGGVLISTLYYWYQKTISDIQDLKIFEIETFSVPDTILHNSGVLAQLSDIFSQFCVEIEQNKILRYKKDGSLAYSEYRVRQSKHYIDQIDDIILPLYGLSQTEVDFIKNYELEFREKDNEQD